MGCCGGKGAKGFLILFNLLFWACGLGLLLFGLWMVVDPQRSYLLDVVNFSEGDPLLRLAAYVLMGCGLVSVVVGFVGCCGAVKEVQSMLAIFALALLLLLCAELAAAIMALVFKSKHSGQFLEDRIGNMSHVQYGRLEWVTYFLDTVQYYIGEGLKRDTGNMIRGDYGKDGDKPSPVSVTALVDKLQFHLLVMVRESAVRSVRETFGQGPDHQLFTQAFAAFQFYEGCCGVEGPEDWTGSFWQTRADLSGGFIVPESCCTQMDEATSAHLVPRSRTLCQTPFDSQDPSITLTDWRYVQNECCGSRGPEDYHMSYWQITKSRGAVEQVPVSCCKLTETSRPWGTLTPNFPRCTRLPIDSDGFRDSAWTKGCYPELEKWFSYYSVLFIALGVSVALFQLVGVVCAISLCRRWWRWWCVAGGAVGEGSSSSLGPGSEKRKRLFRRPHSSAGLKSSAMSKAAVAADSPSRRALLHGVTQTSLYAPKQTGNPRVNRHAQRRYSTSVMIVIVTVIFALCNTLPFVVNIWEAVNPGLFSAAATSALAYRVTDLSNLLVVLNSAVNALVYLLFCQRYRVLFRVLVLRRPNDEDDSSLLYSRRASSLVSANCVASRLPLSSRALTENSTAELSRVTGSREWQRRSRLSQKPSAINSSARLRSPLRSPELLSPSRSSGLPVRHASVRSVRSLRANLSSPSPLTHSPIAYRGSLPRLSHSSPAKAAELDQGDGVGRADEGSWATSAAVPRLHLPATPAATHESPALGASPAPLDRERDPHSLSPALLHPASPDSVASPDTDSVTVSQSEADSLLKTDKDPIFTLV